MFTPSSCKDIGIKKLKFVSTNQFLQALLKAMRRDETIRKTIFY